MLDRSKRTVVNFNPRSREGSDVCRAGQRAEFSNFNPRSREGSDTAQAAAGFAVIQFQSTLPRRERPVVAETPTELQ